MSKLSVSENKNFEFRAPKENDVPLKYIKIENRFVRRKFRDCVSCYNFVKTDNVCNVGESVETCKKCVEYSGGR